MGKDGASIFFVTAIASFDFFCRIVRLFVLQDIIFCPIRDRDIFNYCWTKTKSACCCMIGCPNRNKINQSARLSSTWLAADRNINCQITTATKIRREKMPLFLANLAMSSYFLALCYTLATVLTINKYVEVRRVLRRHHHTGWSTVQLLILSVALGCLFRAATFSTLCIFDSQNAADLPTGIVGGGRPAGKDRGSVLLPPDLGGGDDGSGSDHRQQELDFYNKVVAVLFNLPDFLFVSSYLLLVLVWAEAFQSVRLQPFEWCQIELDRPDNSLALTCAATKVAPTLVLSDRFPSAVDDLLPRLQRRTLHGAGRAVLEPVPA